MMRQLTGVFFAALIFFAITQSCYAIQAAGPTNLANGFPMWWMDDAGVMVEMCPAAACAPDPVEVGNPFSEQVGFGAEAFWWSAGAFATEPAGNTGNAELVLAMEAAWPGENAIDGGQSPFARIRIRADAAVDGTYTITTPYGTLPSITVAPDAEGKRAINISLDIGGIAPDFAGILASGITSWFNVPLPLPVAPPGPVFSGTGAIVPALGVGNTFSISGPANAFGPGIPTISTTTFDWSGKLFIPGVNEAPVGTPDVATTTVGTPVTIDVVLNDLDVIVPGTNEHGINPVATGIVDPVNPAAPLVIGPFNAPVATAGGSVMKNIDGTLTYTPGATFIGTDTFNYMVQDTGGCLPGQVIDPVTAVCDPTGVAVPTLVTVAVVNLTLTESDFRPKLMKWNIAGTAQGADGQILRDRKSVV